MSQLHEALLNLCCNVQTVGTVANHPAILLEEINTQFLLVTILCSDWLTDLAVHSLPTHGAGLVVDIPLFDALEAVGVGAG